MPYLPPPAGAHDPLDLTEANEVLSRYGMAGAAPAPVRLRAGGTARKRVVSSGGHRVLIKQVPWYCDEPLHAEAVAQLQLALRNTTPTAPLLLGIDGAATQRIASRPGAIYTVQKMIDGQPWNGSGEQCSAAGRALRTLHDSTADLCHEPFLAIRAESAVEAAQSALERLRFADASTTRAGWRKATVHHVVGEFRRVLRALAAHDVTVPSAALIHGDFNPSNLLFSNSNEVVAIVDFDNCSWDRHVHDIARGLVHFAAIEFDRNWRFAGLRAQPSAELGGGFLESYGVDRLDEALAPTCGIVAVELSVLGVLNGWFGPQLAQEISTWPERLAAWTCDLVAGLR